MAMRKPQSVKSLEDLGRVRLSPNFYMRDFLYSEVASFYGIPNIPDNPDLAIEAGRHLCEQLLEPLNATFGRVCIRSAYRSPTVNQRCNNEKLGCASNEKNFARHIWDQVDANGGKGATACVFIPWFTQRYDQGVDWRALAYWIHDHLPYSQLQFFPKLCAFNISWHERPKKEIYSFIAPHKGALARLDDLKRGEWYADFPALRKA